MRTHRLAGGVLALWLLVAGHILAADAVAESADAAAPVATEQTAEDVAGVEASSTETEATYFDEFMQKVEQGGVIVKVLLLMSVVMLTFALERICNLRRNLIAPRDFSIEADAMWRNGKWQELRRLCDGDKSVLARVVAVIEEHRGAPLDEIKTIAMDLGSREMRLQLGKAYPLAVVATLAPLLGLLGTIVGMIGAFDKIALAGDMANPAILAGNISLALITTAAGLLVAIPALGFYHYFRSRTGSYAVLLEEEVSGLISSWFVKPIAASETPVAVEAAQTPESKPAADESAKADAKAQEEVVHAN